MKKINSFVHIFAASKNEAALTIRTNNIKKHLGKNVKKGDVFLLKINDVNIPFYVNRADLSTLYCPFKQIPKGFSFKPTLVQQSTVSSVFKVTKIGKVR